MTNLATDLDQLALFGLHRPAGADGHSRFGIQVVELLGGEIHGIHRFLEPRLLPLFGLPTPPGEHVTQGVQR